MKRSVRAGGVEIGYSLSRTNRADILLRAPAPGQLRVYAPAWAHLRDIDRIVREKSGEIAEMWRGFERPPLADGNAIIIEGTRHILHLFTGAPRVDVTENGVAVRAPKPEDARKILVASLSKLALARVRELLEKHAPDAKYGRVTIRAQRTRWGSCSSKRNLNFNWKLILAPPEALEYVVVHELSHLTEFNHSPRFWALVKARLPDYEYWKKWLKDNGKSLNI